MEREAGEDGQLTGVDAVGPGGSVPPRRAVGPVQRRPAQGRHHKNISRHPYRGGDGDCHNGRAQSVARRRGRRVPADVNGAVMSTGEWLGAGRVRVEASWDRAAPWKCPADPVAAITISDGHGQDERLLARMRLPAFVVSEVAVELDSATPTTDPWKYVLGVSSDGPFGDRR